jgi:hypothetical protein
MDTPDHSSNEPYNSSNRADNGKNSPHLEGPVRNVWRSHHFVFLEDNESLDLQSVGHRFDVPDFL